VSPLLAMIEVIFWVCLVAVAFAYLGYPLLILFLAHAFGRKPKPPNPDQSRLPVVSLLIAAHNEESDIEARILNALALDYPADKLEIVIASDGSADGTNEIVWRYTERYRGRVQLFAYETNRGKATVLNDSVRRLRGELVILSDANTFMAPDAALRLAAWFADPDVGVVCGRLVLSDPKTGRNVDSLYWKYETFLKKCESRLGALLGSNGAIYAIRKELFPEVRPGTLIDDFVIPLEGKRRSGCRIVYDIQAVAREETPSTIFAEFRRRVRIGAGGFQSIGLLWPLLSPSHGWVGVPVPAPRNALRQRPSHRGPVLPMAARGPTRLLCRRGSRKLAPGPTPGSALLPAADDVHRDEPRAIVRVLPVAARRTDRRLGPDGTVCSGH
jgi:cellulose synthase/poly-beta-1,6-N-acetylglucosamine synthase-like glycosyltransferase